MISFQSTDNCQQNLSQLVFIKTKGQWLKLLPFVIRLLSIKKALSNLNFCIYKRTSVQQDVRVQRYEKSTDNRQRTTDFFELQLPHHIIYIIVKQSCYIIRFFFSKILKIVGFIKRQCCRISINSYETASCLIIYKEIRFDEI